VLLIVEPIFEADFLDCSYGFRPGRSAHDAPEQITENLQQGRRQVYDADLQSYFDTIPHEKLMACVQKRIVDGSVLKLIRMWLKAVIIEPGDGPGKPPKVSRSKQGTPQGGVISPLLANLFLHHAFDTWMAEKFPHISFERYADDAICHCRSEAQARFLQDALAARLAECKLELHPEKTKLVYCKDVMRKADYPSIHFDFLGFQFRARKVRWIVKGKEVFAHSFLPAVSPKAQTRISREIRRWALHHRSDKSLDELARMYNPVIRGWIGYYSHFYRTQLRPTLKRIDAYVIRWARRKYKRMVHQTKGGRDWFDRLRRKMPRLFAHWALCHGNG
jgi:group II intron reverse transcriptase/maturase